ncbi:response regulator [Coleofasciculus sp. F4-SAH-05]|uniref:response regulator n=1 Tax=Coleofasciculus sp. F4-SAH-05 TaxID=3069525 RepID=UPI0032FAACAC
MHSEQQQRIMGYFMEEAQDHLNTIEQGLLNLQSTIEDPETLNEMFRAAHSVKGGAAMLGLNSIHQTAHRLEDYFKVLQDVPLKADTQLESLLLRVFDTLSALLNQLQSYGLTDETASPIMSDAEPVFEQLNSYLKQLAQNKQTAGDTPTVANSSQSSSKGTKTLPATFKRDVLVELREMLQLYKQSDTSEHRRALQDHCQRLIELGDPLNLPGWGELLEISKRAIANLENSYRLLASVTIKEIKQAQELVLTGRSAEIVPSEQLKALAPDATTVESTTAFNFSTHSSPTPTPATEESNQNQKETTHLPDSRDTYIQAEDTYIQDPNDIGGFRRDQLQFSTVQSSNSISPLSDQGEPEVGIAELNSLADIFETQTPDLDQTWQEEEVINLNNKSLNSDSDDFLDFEDSNDFSDLIGESEDLENSTADDALMQGLGDDFAPDAIANPQASKESSDSLDFSSSLTDDFSDLLFESDSSEDSDQMSHSGDDLNSLFGESFFDEEGEASSAEILSHSELEDLDVEENLPQSSLQGDETVSESDFDFDDLLEISSTEENPRPLGESVNQDDLELEDYLESNDLDRENQLDNNNQAETIDIESATPEAGDVSNPFEETSLADFDQEAWEDSEDLPDFEALNDLFDSEPGVESTPVDSLTEPENDSIVELPTSTDEVLLNESTNSAQKDGDSSESLFEEEGDEILPEVTEDVAELFAEEGEESQGSTAQVEDFDIDWLTDESQGTQQPWTSETESAANLFGDWETPQAPSNEDLDDLFLFAEEEAEATPSTQSEDLEADWLTDESVETPQPETSDTQADVWEEWETPEKTQREDLDDLFAEEEAEASPSTQPEDLEADWLTDESQEIEQPETSDTQADVWEEWDIPETAPSEDLDDLFAEEEAEASPSADLEDLDEDWLTDESVETPQPETSDSAADLFGDWDIPETPSDEDLGALFSLEEATVDDDFSLATLAETEWDLDSPREGADEFADLETMLDGETSAALTSESGNEFADLEAMLVDTPSQTDSCEDLEIFLGEQESTQDNRASVAQTPPSQDKDDLDKELEALLQDVDKSIGGPATTNTGSRQTAPLPSRRPPRIFEQTMRVPVKHLDSLNNLVGELVVSRNSLEQDQERLRQFLDNLQHQVSALSDVGARMRDLYERSLLESSLLASSSSQNQPRDRSLFGSENGASASTDSESAEDYHPLEMDRFTGFHLLSQEMIELIVQVRESASDVEFLVDETDQVARNLRQVTTQLQEGLTRSRMVPFANAADRLTRPVREISRKLSKEAQLQVEGRETLLDKMILEHLYDPLTHLVNNAITHGIESPEERQEMGKPAVGQIILRAFHQGNQTVIAISDDGAGIDPEQIKRKAIEKKLITPAEAKDLTNTELYDFLFHPGFSTKDEASEFAGRGVGMDVVRTSLSEIRGAIYIDSTLGKGTTFTIRLPLTLSICKALCCLSTRARIAFPMDGVEDMFDVPKDRLQKDANGQVGVSWRDTLVSVQPLSELLSYNRSISRGNVYGGKREDDLVSIVVLRSSGTFIAIEVDQVLGEQEIVIKQLEGPPPKPIGIAGATVLGDGRIMPIADVLELIDLASGRLRKDSVTIWSRGDSEGAGIEEAPETPHEPLVLIVDDSITVRELLSMTFAKAGYRVEQSRDGQEAWDKLRSGLPCDIVFCDIEMPRMDGLELLSRLQKDENLSQLPIAMLTSRGAKRHRQMAAQLGASGYFTKPYLEEVLLDAAQRMIQGEVLFSSEA